MSLKKTTVSDGETEGRRQTKTEVELSKGALQKSGSGGKKRIEKRAVVGCTADSLKSQRASVPAPVC